MDYAGVFVLLVVSSVFTSEAMIIKNNCKGCTIKCQNAHCIETCTDLCPRDCLSCSVMCINGVCKENCGGCAVAGTSPNMTSPGWIKTQQQTRQLEKYMSDWQKKFSVGMAGWQKTFGNGMRFLNQFLRRMTSVFG